LDISCSWKWFPCRINGTEFMKQFGELVGGEQRRERKEKQKSCSVWSRFSFVDLGAKEKK
jgi:hypothetical protein